MRIHLVHDLDAHAAARDLLENGMVAIDDITEELIDDAEEDIFEELGYAGDGILLTKQRVDTSWGPVFVLRDPDVVSAAKARAAVLRERPEPKKQAGRTTKKRPAPDK